MTDGYLTVDQNEYVEEKVYLYILYVDQPYQTNSFNLRVICDLYQMPSTKTHSHIFTEFQSTPGLTSQIRINYSSEFASNFFVDSCSYCQVRKNFILINKSDNSVYTGEMVKIEEDYSLIVDTSKQDEVLLEMKAVSDDEYCNSYFEG